MRHWPMIRERFPELEGFCVLESAAIWDALLTHQGLGELDSLGVGGDFLEIGVYRGKTAALMALHADPASERLVLVDPFARPEDTLRSFAQVGLGAARIEPAMRFLHEDSRRLPALPFFVEGRRRFRWIHVDGRHTGEAVWHDLDVAAALCADQGVVVLDDFLSPAYPQITEAAFRFVRERPQDLAFCLMGFGKAYLVRPDAVGSWRRWCFEHLVDALDRREVPVTLCKTTHAAEASYLSLLPRDTGASAGRRVRGPDWDPGTLRLDD